MKNIIVITGGAGFIGSNLISNLIKNTKFRIISIDDYSSGTKENEIRNSRILYLKASTLNIRKILKNKRQKIHTIFHFGEFSRIFQSFEKIDQCMNSNSKGSFEVFKFCIENKIKLIYSATSASLGNKGQDRNLSPYAFSKAKNLELLDNLNKWFGLKYEVVFFYNAYGPNHISKGYMATVIGIFENHYLKRLPIPIVKPGTQTRRFTHVYDIIDVCIEAWKKNKCKKYISTNKENFTIKEVANFFSTKTKILPERKGERYKSTITKSKNTIIRFGKISLKDYVIEFKSKNRKIHSKS